jgi:hypothetical protein
VGRQQLILIGTVHIDPGGERRLIEMLGQLQPAVTTVEVSEYALRFRRDRAPGMSRHLDRHRLPSGGLPPGLQPVAAQLQIPFEYRAAGAHVERCGGDLFAIGDSDESRRLLELFELEVMDPGNLRRLAGLEIPPLEERVEREWSRARRAWERGGRDVTEAERALAERIRDHASHERSVHIGGWEHLANLAHLLRDLAPAATLLGDAPRP